MQKYVPFVLILSVILAGCSTHYYKMKDDTVNIYLKKPDAKEVYFSSSLDRYELHKAKKDDKIWEVSAPANTEFRYFYIVDGAVYLPSCKIREKDDFGSENCIYTPNM